MGEAEALGGGLEGEEMGSMGLRGAHGGIIVSARMGSARRKWE
jgi:hypothetical protein